MYNENLSINRTSYLYHLQPIGIGTPYVESLRSYIKRLAEAHSVSIRYFIRSQIAPDINENYDIVHHYMGTNSIKINSLSLEVTKTTVRVLEEKTCNNGLIYLTMIPWENLFNPRFMFRKNQAWCPICYEEMLQLGQPVYEQLIWGFNDIEICRKHRVRLMKKCPYCGREFSGFSSLSRIGFCDFCKTWLGLKKYENSQSIQVNEEWENWVYDNIGQLLTVAPTLKSVNNLFSSNVKKIKDYNNISYRGLAHHLNLLHSTLFSWKCGMKPRLFDALRFSYKFDYSIIEILLGDVKVPTNGINKKRLYQKKRIKLIILIRK